MDPISNVDRITLLLRQRLLDRAKAGSASKAGGASGAARSAEAQTGVSALTAAAALGALDDRQLGRSLIQSVLCTEFGDDLINDARFQQVVDRVTEALQADEGTSALLARAVADLRSHAR